MSEKEYETRLPIGGEDGEQDQDDYEEFEDFEEPNVLRLIKWIPYMLKHLLWIVGCWIVVAVPIVILILVDNLNIAKSPSSMLKRVGLQACWPPCSYSGLALWRPWPA
ncbi:hypothetical protein DSO57_1005740 [Entomophthora muscae]|uniref:Uncharacterized protein n=1 Tax=Entomophthora muscae TaxID=34485 RepID=A0ACC2T7Y4_9FUNG|nr:hypothetical protein DSO57_1005740 [Entomophthora muscae]